MLKHVLLGLAATGILLTFFANGLAQEKAIQIIMKTSKGDITLELYPDKAPITVENVLTYVDEKFYDGTIFHRVIKGFMIQGGGWTKDFQQKQTYEPIKNEADNGLKNLKYTVAMARMPPPHTATAQFFINVVDNPGLDYVSSDDQGYGYCVFGKVISGQDVVDAIGKVKTMTKNRMADVPRENIEIISVRRK